MRIDEDDLAWDLPSMAPAASPYSAGAGGVTSHSVHPGALSSIREDASALSSHNSSLRHSHMAARPSAYPAYPMGAFSAPSAFLAGGFGADLRHGNTRSSPEDETSPGTDGLDGADADGIDMDEGMDNGAEEGAEEVQRLKPHKCDTCGACFARKVHLQRHALRHVTSKPYSCELCGKCFSRQDSLVRHNRLLHEKDGRGRVGSNGKPLPPASFRNRSPKACLRCSQLKTRCDGNEPCARCVSHNLGGPGECTYRPGADRRSRSSSSRGVSAPRPERRQSMLDGVESDDEGAEEKPARGRPLSRFDAGSASSNGSASNASVGERGTSIYSASYDDGRVLAAAPLSPASWQSASSIGAHFSSMHLQQSGSQQSHNGAPGLLHQRSHSQQAMPTDMSGHHHHDANHAFIQAQHTNQAAFLGLSLPQQLDIGGTNGFGANTASNNFFLQQHQQQQQPQPQPQQQQQQQQTAPQQQSTQPTQQQQQSPYPASFAQAVPPAQQTSDFFGVAPSTAPLHLSFSAPAHTAVGFSVPPANGHTDLGHSNGTSGGDDAFATNLHLEFDWSDYLPGFPLAGTQQNNGPTVSRPRVDGLGFQPSTAPSGPMKNNPFGGSMFLAPAARGMDLGDLEAAMNADSPLASHDVNSHSTTAAAFGQQNVSESLASLAHQLGSADGHYWDTTSFTTR